MDSQGGSLSSSVRAWKYDVVVSYNSLETFRFYSMLWNALWEEGLRIGRSRGDPLEIIEESQIYLVVFSQRYAASPSCLDKLAKMLECMKVPGHGFLPIFFGVVPSEVSRWLAPCKTLLNNGQELVIQNREDQRRVIGKIVVEAKKFLANENDTFAMDFQGNLLQSSKWIWPWSCDVFISFITEDSCSFVELLSDALNRTGFTNASSDSTLRGPLEKYRLYMIVFSKNHATSTRFLQELEAIKMECSKPLGPRFLQIFFELGRTQELRQKYELVIPHQRDWKRVVDEIVKKSIKILGDKHSTISKLNDIDEVAKKIDKSDQIATVGISDQRVENLVKLLELGSMDVVRTVGISGMGGAGKTALAADVFKKISGLFDSAYFLTRPCGNPDDPNEVDPHQVLLRITLQEEYELYAYNIQRSLRTHRVLIVLDGVDDWISFHEYLNGQCDWFGKGSRIIITSRDKHVLKKLEVDVIHNVELLTKDEALRLFCKTVFKRNYPKRGYEELTLDALKYADGLPLAIESLGSFLVDLSVSDWQSALTDVKEKTIFHEKLSSVLKVLQESLSSLDDKGKTTFLDITCCFAEQKIDYVKEILTSQYEVSEVESIISNLMDKSLINISNEKIKMHYMLQRLGKEMVQRESIEPGERSRIWRYEDFCHIMETNTGTDRIEVIVLSDQEYPQGTSLNNVQGLSQMRRLRILIFHNINFSGNYLYFLSDELRYLSWHNYPFYYLPLFKPEYLVELNMPCSRITLLWRHKQISLPKLRNLNLSGSKNLKKTPDFGLIPNLEKLDLEGCTSLLQLHPSIAFLQGLKYLNLRNCTNLGYVPNDLFCRSSLEFLNLAGCSKFAECLSLWKKIVSWFSEQIL